MRLTTVSITTIAITTAIVTMVLLTACNTGSPKLVGNDRDAHGCIGSAGYSWCEAKQQCLRPWEEKCEAAQNGSVPPMPGSDRDAHGCIGSAGYSWCEAKQQCIRPWEENCTATPTDGLPTEGSPSGQGDSCTCPAGYVKDGDACNPKCYYSTPKCLMPSIMCSPSAGAPNQGGTASTGTGDVKPIGATRVIGAPETNSTVPNGMG